MTDYNENPLFMDYYGLPASLYSPEIAKFDSRGDSALSQRIVQLLKEVPTTCLSSRTPVLTVQKQHISARTLTQEESRGTDGRGLQGRGFDHGGIFLDCQGVSGCELTCL